MESEIRTPIVQPDDAIDAVFDLFEYVLGDANHDETLDSAVVRPVERVQRRDALGRTTEVYVSYEVTFVRPGDAVSLPEPERVLVHA